MINTENSNPTLDAALEYVAHGLAVFPVHSMAEGRCSCGKTCNSPGKHPRTLNGFKDATTDPAAIIAFWNRWPDANIGLPTGEMNKIVVVDEDPRNGGDVTLAELMDRHGHFPDTPTQRTGGGGRHFIFRHPGYEVKGDNRGNTLGTGVDIKGAGGYIVVPPSRTTGAYVWEFESDIFSLEPAALPEWVEEKIKAKPPRTNTKTNGSTAGTIPNGQRNSTLASLAGSLHNRGLSADELTAALHDGNKARCSPPLDGGEVDSIAQSIARYDRHFTLTDTGNAERFANLFGDRVRYVKAWNKWLIYSGVRWERDETGEAERLAKQTARSIYVEAAQDEDERRRVKKAAWAKTTEQAARRVAMLALAQSEPPIALAPSALDRDPWLLNTVTATVDLRTGQLRQHDARDLLTKLAPVAFDPAAPCPLYRRFMDRIFAGDTGLIEYVERFIGYALTGDIRHHHLPIAWGDGQNGKSTLFDLVLHILGDYAIPAPESLLTVRAHEEHATEVAGLHGLRLAIATETDEGRKLRIGMVKRLTGDAKLTGRYMRCDYFNFDRTHKTILVSNNRPRVTEDSTAVWRRLRLIPFTVTIPTEEQDPALPEKLKEEAPGILVAWVRACLRWQAEGFDLAEPKAVTEATAEYRDNEDVLAEFTASDCILGPNHPAARKELWQAYQRWAERERVTHPLGQHGLYERIRRVEGVTEGSVTIEGNGRKGFHGIGIAYGGPINA